MLSWAFLGYKENQPLKQDPRQCKSSNEIVFQRNLCFHKYAFMEHCLERQVCSEMKGNSSFYFVVSTLEFLLKLFVAFCFLVDAPFLWWVLIHLFALIKVLNDDSSVRQLLYKGSGIKGDIDPVVGNEKKWEGGKKRKERTWVGIIELALRKISLIGTTLFKDWSHFIF